MHSRGHHLCSGTFKRLSLLFDTFLCILCVRDTPGYPDHADAARSTALTGSGTWSFLHGMERLCLFLDHAIGSIFSTMLWSRVFILFWGGINRCEVRSTYQRFWTLWKATSFIKRLPQHREQTGTPFPSNFLCGVLRCTATCGADHTSHSTTPCLSLLSSS